MYITKVIDTTVDLLDPNDIYQHDIQALVTKKLFERYNKKCYQSMLILDIINIVRTGPVMMVDNRLDGGAYVDVQFKAGGIIFIRDEIINNCKVIEVHANAITVEHEYAGIKLKKEPGGRISKILTPGKHIPVVVDRVKYIAGQSNISMIGFPYIPSAEAEELYYNITSGITPEETEKLGVVIDMIEKEEKLHVILQKKKQYGFFRDLLYPYKVNQKFEQSTFAKNNKLAPKSIELKTMLQINSGFVVYPDKIPKSKKIFMWASGDSAPTSNAINGPAYPILSSICNKYLLYLRALRGFVETYDKPAKMQPLITYWKLCKNAKL